MDRPLRAIAFTIEKVEGSKDSHQMTRAHMLYVLECMDPTIFNWSEGILVSVKDRLKKWR